MRVVRVAVKFQASYPLLTASFTTFILFKVPLLVRFSAHNDVTTYCMVWMTVVSAGLFYFSFICMLLVWQVYSYYMWFAIPHSMNYEWRLGGGARHAYFLSLSQTQSTQSALRESHNDLHHSLSSILTGKRLEGISIKNGWLCCSAHPVLGLLYCIKWVNRQWKITHVQTVSNRNLASQRKIYQENNVEHWSCALPPVWPLFVTSCDNIM